jgi:zinc protease
VTAAVDGFRSAHILTGLNGGDVLRFKTFAAVSAALLLAVPGAAADPVVPDLAIAPDPDVAYGTLPNGLRYAIVKAPRDDGRISLRLAFNVGSFEEADEERGAAHFVEHMAFRANGAFPGDEGESRFARAGAAFGRDVNAFTSVDATQYKLDFPKTSEAVLADALRWLRGVADGVTFTAAAVDAERGAVQAEKATRSNIMSRIGEDVARFQAPGARSFARLPIGTDQSLAAMSPERLSGFYRRWYRPDHALLVVASRLPAEQVKAAIGERFGSWRATGPAPARASTRFVPQPSAPGVFVRASDQVPVGSIAACQVRPAEPKTLAEAQRFRHEALDLIAAELFNARAEELTKKPEHKLLGAALSFDDSLPDLRNACVAAVPIGEEWEPGLRQIRSAWTAFLAAPATEAELSAGLERVRSRLRGGAIQAGDRTAESVADGVMGAWLAGRPYLSPAQKMRAYNIGVEGVTPADLKQRLADLWPDTTPSLAAVLRTAPEERLVLAAWNDGAAKSATAEKKAETADWPYWPNGKAGKVARREAFADPRFTRFRFRNGTVLNLYRTDFAADTVEVRVSFGRGREQIRREDRFAGELGGQLMLAGGLRQSPVEDIQRRFLSNVYAFKLDVGPHSFLLSGNPFADQLGDQLNLMAAYLKEPGFRPDMDARVAASFGALNRMLTQDAAAVAKQALERKLYPPELQSLPDPADVQALNSKTFERVLQPILTSAPVEVTLVGDVDEKAAVEAVGKSFGAWPAREPVPAVSADVFRRLPTDAAADVTARHTGEGGKAALNLVLPLYVATPERRREELAINLLGDIMEASLRHRLRGELGKTYAPRVAVDLPDHADQGVIELTVETSPADLALVETEAKAILKRLAAGEISEQQLEDARQPLAARMEQSLKSNRFWASVLAGSSEDASRIADAQKLLPLTREITLADLKKAAADWLSRPALVARSVPEQGGSGTGR